MFREFFSREAGRNTVEFFKDDGNGQLFIALRFESKDIAKEVLNRYTCLLPINAFVKLKVV